MFNFQEFELRLSLPTLRIKFAFYKVYNCVSVKKKKAIRKGIVRPFWYSQEPISVNAPKHVDYISLKLHCFHTLTEKEFERGKRNIWDVNADFNHQKTKEVKLPPQPIWISQLSSGLPMALVLCGQSCSCSRGGGTDFVLKLEPKSLWTTLTKLQIMLCWCKKVKMVFFFFKWVLDTMTRVRI